MASGINCSELECLIGGHHHHTDRDLEGRNRKNGFIILNVNSNDPEDRLFMYIIYCSAIWQNINLPTCYSERHGMTYVGEHFKCSSFKVCKKYQHNINRKMKKLVKEAPLDIPLPPSISPGFACRVAQTFITSPITDPTIISPNTLS